MIPAFNVAYEVHRDVAIIINAGVLTQSGFEPASLNEGKVRGYHQPVCLSDDPSPARNH